VNSRTAIAVPSAFAEKISWSRSFAPQKRIRSGERTITVQSSIILPLSSQRAV
jgi:hypothetical protein